MTKAKKEENPLVKKIEEFTEIELKAAIGDLFLQREPLQQQLQMIHQQINVINQELAKRKKNCRGQTM